MNEKKVLNERISQRDEAITELQEQQAIVYANLGQLLVEIAPPSEPELKNLHEKAGNLVSEIHGLEDSLRRILTDDDRRQNISNELKNVSNELKSIEKKQETAAEDIGRAAWNLWKAGGAADSRFQDAMADLVAADEKLRRSEDVLLRYEQDSENEKRTKKVLTQGKTFILNNRKRLASAALNRQWKPTGLKLLEIEDKSVFDGTPVLSEMATFEALEAQHKELLNKKAALKSESEAVEANLEHMPGKGGAKRRQALLESNIEDKQNELEEAYRQLGIEWLKTAGTSTKTPAELVERRREIDVLDQRIQELESEKAALAARVEILELESQRRDILVGFERLEKEVRQKQTILKERKKELNSLEKEISSRRENLPPEPKDEASLS